MGSLQMGENIKHIVHFEFYPHIQEDVAAKICQKFLSLRDMCIHPHTNKPYILSTSGGRNISPEGLQGNFSHSFIFEFANIEDRDYYIKKDSAHMSFGRDQLTGIVSKVMVMDFLPGMF